MRGPLAIAVFLLLSFSAIWYAMVSDIQRLRNAQAVPPGPVVVINYGCPAATAQQEGP